jgi:hypothetical protein
MYLSNTVTYFLFQFCEELSITISEVLQFVLRKLSKCRDVYNSWFKNDISLANITD